jgi:p-aminobenzoyl-glutamate transporter AbgT
MVSIDATEASLGGRIATYIGIALFVFILFTPLWIYIGLVLKTNNKYECTAGCMGAYGYIAALLPDTVSNSFGDYIWSYCHGLICVNF